MKKTLILLCFCVSATLAYTQKEDSLFIDFSAYVKLDSIMITAKREGFSVEDFIKIIQEDNTLEASFNNLRTLSYRYKNDIRYFDNRGRVKASYESTNVQRYNGDCQWMQVLKEDRLNDYEKFYTTDLYSRVFYQPTTPCAERVASVKMSRSRRILEDRIEELKKLIYTPGKRASVPLIGDKTAIFSEEMIEHYDFSLSSRDGSYVFVASINPFYNMDHPNGSVVKFLEVELAKGSFQVLKRNYKLQYNAGIYHFDILMKVTLEQHDGMYIPSDIVYDGYWKVVGKPKENCKFHFEIIEFL